VTSEPARLGISVGITNTRLSASKRGVAIECALRLAGRAHVPVCLVGADPTDRDVEHRTPPIDPVDPRSARMRLEHRNRTLDVAMLGRRQVCVISVSDRAGFESVLPEIQGAFRYVLIDAPSRAGTGVGISHGLLRRIDALVVVSGSRAGELAEARVYLERLERIPDARRIETRVLTTGYPDDSELSREQFERRARRLPTIGEIPQLWGRRAGTAPSDDDRLEHALGPLLQWIIGMGSNTASPTVPPLALPASPGSARIPSNT